MQRWGVKTERDPRALGECLGTLHDTAYRMAYKKQNWVGECATTRVEAARTSAAADTATVGSVSLASAPPSSAVMHRHPAPQHPQIPPPDISSC